MYIFIHLFLLLIFFIFFFDILASPFHILIRKSNKTRKLKSSQILIYYYFQFDTSFGLSAAPRRLCLHKRINTEKKKNWKYLLTN